MFTYKIFNNIAKDGLNILDGNHFHIDEINPDSLILRSQNLSNEDFNKSLKCIGRAGAGTNNIPVNEATEKGIVVFNTPGANANAVKELVAVSYTHLRAHETKANLVCRLLLEKKKKKTKKPQKFKSQIEK